MKYSTTLHLFLVKDGGRPFGFFAGYCPYMVIEGDDTMYAMRVISVNGSDKSFINPSETANVVMAAIYNEGIDCNISVGQKFVIKEAVKAIGSGSVLEIV